MADTCKIARETAEDIKQLDDVIDEGTIKQEEELGWRGVVEDLDAELIVKYLAGQVVPKDEIKDFIKNTYGAHWERYWIATKIMALTSANPMVSGMIKEYIWKYMPTGFKGDDPLSGVETRKNKKTGEKETFFFGTGGLTREAYNKLDKKGKLKVALKVMSKEDLMIIYSEIHKWVTSGTGGNWGATGLIGRFLTKFRWLGGRELSKKERSGAYYKFTQHITKYYTMIDNDTGNFMVDRVVTIKHKDGTTTTKKVKGMNSIFDDIFNLADNIEGWDIDIDYRQSKGDMFFELFTMIMNGEVLLKNGKFMGYSNYGPLQKQEGGPFEAHPDGTLKHIYSNLVELDAQNKDGSYIFYGGKFGGLNLNANQLKKLETAVKEARKIDDQMFKAIKKQHKETSLKLIKSLLKHFPDLSDNELTTLFFEEWKTITHTQILNKLKQLDKDHKKGYIDKYRKFKSTFGNLASVSRFVNQATDSDYQKNHWPKKYNKATFDFQWDNYIKSLKTYAKKKSQEIEDEKSKDAPDKKKIDIDKEKLQNVEFLKKRAESIRNNTRLYPEDALTTNSMPFLKDQKHLRVISGAFDIRVARKDRDVYRDYIEESFSAINRNKLTITLLDSLLISESEAVDDALINFYKVPFNDPSVIGFGGLSENQLAKAFSGFNKNITGRDINRVLRRMNKYLTASKLGGAATAFINKAAIVQTMQDRNYRLVRHSMDFLDANSDNLQDFITRAGVASFKDFFNKALLSGKAGFEMDNATAERIYAIMLNYPKLKEKFNQMSLSDLKSLAKKHGIPTKKLKQETIADDVALKEIHAEFRTVLDKSPAFNLKIEDILSKEEIGARRKDIRSSKLDSILDKYVQYSLTYEFELNKFAFEVDWNYTPVTKIMQKGLKGAYTVGGVLMQGYGRIRRSLFGGLTMSDGEAWIRSVSFIANVIQAQKLGYVRGDVPMWQLTGEDMATAMEIGRLGSNYSNMGLSSTDVGQTAWGSHGNFMHKFNIWALQKRGRDMRVMRNATNVQKQLWELGRQGGKGNLWKQLGINLKAVSKMIGKALINWPKVFTKTGYKKMNVAQKQQAHMIKFLNIGVLPALLLDIIVWGPIGGIFFFPLIRVGMKAMGAEQGIRGLPSQMAQIVSMAIAQAIRMAWDDDEWEAEKLIRWMQMYSRNIFPLGYGGNFGWDWMLLINAIATEDVGRAMQLIKPDAIPLPPELIEEFFKLVD